MSPFRDVSTAPGAALRVATALAGCAAGGTRVLLPEGCTQRGRGRVRAVSQDAPWSLFHPDALLPAPLFVCQFSAVITCGFRWFCRC